MPARVFAIAASCLSRSSRPRRAPRREAAESLFRGSGQGVLYGRRHERRRSIQRKRGERPHFRDVRRSPDGRCLIQGIHASLPSGEQPDGEFFPTSFLGKGTSFPRSPGAARSSCLKTAFPAGLSAAISKRASPSISSTISSSGTLDIVRMKILWRTREGWLKTVSIPATATASTL